MENEPGKRVRRGTLAKLALIIAISGPALLIGAALGSRLGLWSWKFGLGVLTLKIAPLLILVAFVFSVVVSIIAFRAKRDQRLSTIALLLATASVVWCAHFAIKGKVLPRISDISTDVIDPPDFSEAIRIERGPGMNPLEYVGKKTNDGQLVSELQLKHYPAAGPQYYKDDPDKVFTTVLEHLEKGAARQVVNADKEAGIIEFTDTTYWYGFTDDVIVRVRADEDGKGTRLDVRSVSRVGVSDLGRNAKRIALLLSTWDKDLGLNPVKKPNPNR